MKALARAFRWRRMMEAGRYATIDELAAAEKIPSEACWVEAIGRLRQQVVDVALQDGLQQMRVDADLGGDQAGDARRPVQQRVAYRAADPIERGIGLGDVDQAALGLVEREALRFYATVLNPVRFVTLVVTAQVLAQIGTFTLPALLPEFIARWGLCCASSRGTRPSTWTVPR